MYTFINSPQVHKVIEKTACETMDLIIMVWYCALKQLYSELPSVNMIYTQMFMLPDALLYTNINSDLQIKCNAQFITPGVCTSQA